MLAPLALGRMVGTSARCLLEINDIALFRRTAGDDPDPGSHTLDLLEPLLAQNDTALKAGRELESPSNDLADALQPPGSGFLRRTR